MVQLDQENTRAISFGSKNGILANGAIARGGANATHELTGAGRALDIETQAHVVARDGFTSLKGRSLGFDDLRREASSAGKRYQIGG